ncbi:acyl-CoA N-acyltransferase [Paraphoma chrysanthemicola]|nr:acyl-CoA N-acyltransferase [Paraphoma chrysanthemicola]
MPIRPATPADEPALGALLAAAFFDEHLFGHTFHPYRHEYPADVVIFWRNWIRKDFAEPRNRIVVCTTLVNGAEKITGTATWTRQGDDEAAKEVIDNWKKVEDREWQNADLSTNRALDPSKQALMKEAYPFFKHLWDGTVNGVPKLQNWYLHLCGVHPEHQKQGVGQQLVHWGLDRAREEGVHASVLASDGNDKFYLRCGFDEVIGNCTEGEGNPLGREGVKGGDCLFMWAGDKKKKT